MTPILISRSQINDPAWNALVEKSRQGIVYAFTYYLDLICSEWKALVWPAADDYQIVMPLPCRRRFGIEILYQPVFCQYLGLFSREQLTFQQADQFIKIISERYSYISSYSFNPENYELLHTRIGNFDGLIYQTYFTHRLDLDQDYYELRANYSSDRLTNLKRAETADWELLPSSNIHPLIYLFVSNHAGKIRGGVHPDAYNRLEALYMASASRDQADIWYAVKSGRIHAGVLLIRGAGKVVYIFNAADKVGRRENARTFLLDQYLRKYSSSSQLFDFESPPVTSIASFYNTFGAQAVPFLSIRKNRLPFPFKQIQEWRRREIKTS